MVALNIKACEFADVVSCGVMNESMAKQGNRGVSPDFNSLQFGEKFEPSSEVMISALDGSRVIQENIGALSTTYYAESIQHDSNNADLNALHKNITVVSDNLLNRLNSLVFMKTITSLVAMNIGCGVLAMLGGKEWYYYVSNNFKDVNTHGSRRPDFRRDGAAESAWDGAPTSCDACILYAHKFMGHGC